MIVRNKRGINGLILIKDMNKHTNNVRRGCTHTDTHAHACTYAHTEYMRVYIHKYVLSLR